MKIRIVLSRALSESSEDILEDIKRPVYEWQKKFACKGIRIKNIEEEYSGLANVDVEWLNSVVFELTRDKLDFFEVEDLKRRLCDEYNLNGRNIEIIGD